MTVKFQTNGAIPPTPVAAAAKADSHSAANLASKPSAAVHQAAVHNISSVPSVARVATTRHTAPVLAPKEAAAQQHPPATDMFGPHPPNIRFTNGLLSIEADNSILTDILYEVGSKTGAEIQMPPWSDAGRERVVAKLGPGNPRDVIAALLHGSSFNYVIVESPQGLQQLILTPKVDWPGPQGDTPPPAAAAPPADVPPPDATPPSPENPQS